MTIRPARLGTPRRVILGLRPRTGARRRSGAAAPSNPILTSGATSWFSAKDGSGLQVINSRIGAAAITLGAGSGVDTNDPVWDTGPPNGWTFDATDDFISSTATVPNITNTTGKHTVLILFTMGFSASGHFWSTSSSTLKRCQLIAASGSSIQGNFRGGTTAFGTTAQLFPSTTAGTKTVVGMIIDNGVATTYIYQSGTGTLGTPGNFSGIGTMTPLQAPRYGNVGYATTNPIGSTFHDMVEWVDLTPGQSTLDAVSDYLITNA